ncbi:hypothetical protein Tco_0853215 [Tanacetum coccineum]
MQMNPYEAYKCSCGAGNIVLRKSYQPHSLGKLYYACPRSKVNMKKFLYLDDLDLQLRVSSSHGPSTPQGKRSKDKMLEARLKMLETRLEMERHPEDHACQSAAMLHELLNDMENLRME